MDHMGVECFSVALSLSGDPNITKLEKENIGTNNVKRV